MMKLFLLSISFFITSQVWSQQVEVVKYNNLEQRWKLESDTLFVINFWATWCKPCVEELPDFIKLDKQMEGKPFKMILVSLDFRSQITKRVIPFLKNKDIRQEVLVLDDDPNVWINQVSKDWDGAIPATLFVKNGQQAFYAKQMDYSELIEIIKNFNR